jgi:Flp pilus assembly protein TadD
MARHRLRLARRCSNSSLTPYKTSMATLAQILDEALKHRNSGNLQVAEDLCRRVLEMDSRNVQALHLLALIAAQSGGNVLAEGYLRQAIQLKPDLAELHRHLGIILRDMNREEEAEASIRTALRLNPNDAEAYSILGGIFLEQRKLEEAVACYQQGLRLKPDCAYIYNNMGVALRFLKRQEEAKSAFQQAIRLKPDYAEAHNNSGAVLEDQGELDQAVPFLKEAIRLKPDYAEAFGNLGNICHKLGNLDWAKSLLQEAIRLKSDYAEAYMYLGAVFQLEGELDKALTAYRKSLSLKPTYDLAHFNLGVALLLLGHLEEGWTEYEWRRKIQPLAYERFPVPLWDGSPLDGKTILLQAEQGLGDTLQFVRYAPLLKQRGGTVIVECPAELMNILRSCMGINDLIACGSSRPRADVHAPLLSLPGIMKTTLATVPAPIPYLSAEPARVEKWRHHIGDIAAGSSLKIGIVWQGNPRFAQPECRPADRRRSIPLANFETLARVAGVRLFSLQKGYGTEQLGQEKFGQEIVNLDEDIHDFMDTAAAMMNLDVIISADTAPAHLAGALGRPVWIVLPFAGCWRWLLGRDDSPWYPTMRLFRQKRRGDWGEVFDEMAEALRTLNVAMPTI